MYKTRNISFVVWIISLTIFSIIIFFPTKYEETIYMLTGYFRFILLISFEIGVISFVLFFISWLRSLSHKPTHLSNIVKIVLLVLTLFLIVATWVFVYNWSKEISNEKGRLVAISESPEPATPIIPDLIPESDNPVHGFQPKPIITFKNEKHAITGIDRMDLCKNLDTDKIIMTDGTTGIGMSTYNLAYELLPLYTAAGYTIGKYTVTLDITKTLPEWSMYEKASASLKSDWEVYLKLITKHEMVHQNNDIEYAYTLVKSFNSFGYYPTEKELTEAAQNKLNQTTEELQKIQNNYDDVDKNNNPFIFLCY